MSDYTPTTEQVREQWCHSLGRSVAQLPEVIAASFDRWLAAHDEQVRADERERIAQAIEAVPHGHRCLYTASHYARIARTGSGEAT